MKKNKDHLAVRSALPPIPSVLARQVERGIVDYLSTTFPVTNPFFENLMPELLGRSDTLFKGPYISIKLPFVLGGKDRAWFEGIPPNGFHPWKHQEVAFERLSAEPPRSTLVATGTGSGKTECFLYPILDHCRRMAGKPGVKAILIYPMNALASDQARRIAERIHGSDLLRDRVTAGLYVGGRESEGGTGMTETGVITDRALMRQSPPDILLTNFKMLDFLLIRAEDYPLWLPNLDDPTLLRYLVVDELHTFDGAQGTDLACLIRRLRERLKTVRGTLCCVGTSATLGDKAGEGVDRLVDYAGRIFGEPFGRDAVIDEQIQTPEEFLGQIEREDPTLESRIPGPDEASALDPLAAEDVAAYLNRQHELWFGTPIDDLGSREWRFKLRARLLAHPFLRYLVQVVRNDSVAETRILEELDKCVPDFAVAPPVYKRDLLCGFLALVSMAIKPQGGGLPFLRVRCQFWQRELKRLVSTVSDPPKLELSDDLPAERKRRALPVLHCWDCGMAGWIAVKPDRADRLNPSLKEIYLAFFNRDKRAVYLFPVAQGAQKREGKELFQHYLCPRCLALRHAPGPEPCERCGQEAEGMIELHERSVIHHPGKHAERDCPFCNGKNTLSIFGAQAASLISVAVTQLYASTANSDKKLLTFSDSVQDASHKAGFFAARTYRFNLRSALQKVARANEGATIPDLTAAFLRQWKALMSPEEYVASFFAPDMEWLEAYQEMLESGTVPPDGDAVSLADRRIAWEIWSEYTFNCRLGRSLEKCGGSTLAFDAARLGAAATCLHGRLREEIGYLREVPREAVETLLAGLLLTLKNRGGVHHPMLAAYMREQGNTYTLSRNNPALPRFGPSMRAPMFLSDTHGDRFDTLLRRGGTSATWYEDWARKCFGPHVPGYEAQGDRASEIYPVVIAALEEEGILRKVEEGAKRVWGVSEAILGIACDVRQFRCERCSHQVSMAASDAEVARRMTCLRYGCEGRYLPREEADHYFRRLYDEGDVKRVFTREHTGLLERDAREKIERDFIAGDLPAAPNLLSCTPTLEMGVDIGDLSSIVLCSVPPAQSNYLQRIGRAGRKTGNAFVMTVSRGRPHDLFFFAEPEEMIQGRVEPPGCYLNASAVLERQYLAYLLDRWVESSKGEAPLPQKMLKVLQEVESKEPRRDRFPNDLIAYHEKNRASLKEGFLAIFGEELATHTVERLSRFIDGTPESGDVGLLLRSRFEECVTERQAHKNRVRKLTEDIKKLEERLDKDKDHLERIEEFANEKRALQKIIYEIERKPLLNFLTDEGLLPNYAFPETGVALKSVIIRRPKRGAEGKRYETSVFEYQRSAASAITELAPDNSFYADGRKVVIDQINMALSKAETWRFCPVCPAMANEAEKERFGAAECPQCGAKLWSDDGQKRTLVRVKQVLASTSDRKSRSFDENEERQPEFYDKDMFVRIDPAAITRAFRIDDEDTAFGFEFLDSLTLREVNFGKAGSEERARVAGREVNAEGFRVCKQCGKVGGLRNKRRKRDEPFEHAANCRYHGRETETPLLEMYYLYRELRSEGIRMLLPLSEFEAEIKVQSFLAALMLGLRLKFRGDVGHLKPTVYSTPDRETGIPRKYLVLYDMVPGGTGYLKELMRAPEELLGVFGLALAALERCGCKDDPEKDGCYRCLLAYQGRFDRENTSRGAALDILRKILDRREKIVAVKSVDEIEVAPLVESELEAAFLHMWGEMGKGGSDVKLSKCLVRGKVGYQLKAGDLTWEIEPQVTYGPEQGVACETRADFVFHPAWSKTQGGVDRAGVKPVAVYLDGFAFHANPGTKNLRIGRDTAQRMALLRSGRCRVFAFTHQDVEAAKKGLKEADHLVEPEVAMMAQAKKALGAKFGGDAVAWLARLRAGPVALFLDYLKRPDEKMWCAYAGSLLAAHLSRDGATGRAAWDDLLGRWRTEGASGPWPPDLPAAGGDRDAVVVGRREIQDPDGTPRLRMVVGIGKEDLAKAKVERAEPAIWFNDGAMPVDLERYRKVWNTFLHLMNQCQFAENGWFVSALGAAGEMYAGIGPQESETMVAAAPASPAEDALCDLLDSCCGVHEKSVVTRVFEAGLLHPEIGYEWMDATEILGTASIAWPDHRVCLIERERGEEAEAFRRAGWTVFELEAAAEASGALETALRKGKSV